MDRDDYSPDDLPSITLNDSIEVEYFGVPCEIPAGTYTVIGVRLDTMLNEGYLQLLVDGIETDVPEYLLDVIVCASSTGYCVSRCGLLCERRGWLPSSDPSVELCLQ